jgi:hypothetical protein
VTEKIVGIAELAAEQRKAAAAPPPRKPAPRREPDMGVRPLVMKYVIPARARIELWDSAVAVVVAADDTLENVAVRTGAPGWAIAQINSLDENAPLQVGSRLLIPRSVYVPGLAQSDPQSDAAIGAARVRPSSSIR